MRLPAMITATTAEVGRRGRSRTAVRVQHGELPRPAPCGSYSTISENRQIGRLFALQDAMDVTSRALVLVDDIRPIGHQAAVGDELRVVHHGHRAGPLDQAAGRGPPTLI
jgi:hypothetical protein